MNRTGRHAAQRAALLRFFDDYVDAAYTPVGQRGIVINLVGAFLLLVNLGWLALNLLF